MDKSYKFPPLVSFVRLVAVANALWLVCGGGPWHTGSSGTFDTALMAITIPLFIDGLWVLGLLPIGLAIALQGEGTALAVIGVQALGVIPWAVVLLAATPIIIFAPWKEIAQNNMVRLKMWSIYLGHWWEVAPYAIGFGADTFRFRGPHLPVEGVAYAWAHNDWLEILFNHGIIGLLLAVCVYIYLLKVARPNKRIFLALLGFGACMTFYSPLRVITGQVILFALCLEIRKIARQRS